jgi:spermidine/putrescine transport system substrate-binding protein
MGVQRYVYMAAKSAAKLLLMAALVAGCGAPPNEPLILHDFEGDIPVALLAEFTAETNIPVELVTFEATEEAVANLREGQVYDLVVMENRYIPSLIEEKLLSPIRHYKLANFKNIAVNFRDLVYDPGNRYSVPYTWGTTAMLARTDLVAEPVTRWADLWDPRYAGRVAVWRGQPREVIGLTLRSLGYSANEESPEALAKVQERLLELRPNVQFVEDTDPVAATPLLADGSVVITMGYSNDALLSRKEKLPVDYILPDEGALLWGDNYVIPASARQPDKAEQLIDFLLRPENSAKITHANYFATANEAAMQYLEPELASDPALFPPQAAMQRTEIVLPLSAEGEELYARVWDAFLAAGD